MSNLVTIPTNTPVPFDGFAYDDGEAIGGAVYAKFDGAAMNKWHGRDGALKTLGPYIVANLFPELLKWSGKKVVDRILPEPGEKLPDVDALNNAIPLTEWEEDFNGNPRGPWVKNYTVQLLDPQTAAKLVVSNSTVGMRQAYQELKTRTMDMRKFRGDGVHPVVTLGEKPMKTSFGTKLRPHFEIDDWRAFGAPAAPNPIEAQVAKIPIEGPRGPVITSSKGPIGPLPGAKVKKPTSAEIIGETPPWDDPLPANM